MRSPLHQSIHSAAWCQGQLQIRRRRQGGGESHLKHLLLLYSVCDALMMHRTVNRHSFCMHRVATAADIQETLKFPSARGDLVAAAQLACTLLPSHHDASCYVCPVPWCNREDAHARLSTHALADHFELVKTLTAVLRKLTKACEGSDACILSEEHVKPLGSESCSSHPFSQKSTSRLSSPAVIKTSVRDCLTVVPVHRLAEPC